MKNKKKWGVIKITNKKVFAIVTTVGAIEIIILIFLFYRIGQMEIPLETQALLSILTLFMMRQWFYKGFNKKIKQLTETIKNGKSVKDTLNELIPLDENTKEAQNG